MGVGEGFLLYPLHLCLSYNSHAHSETRGRWRGGGERKKIFRNKYFSDFRSKTLLNTTVYCRMFVISFQNSILQMLPQPMILFWYYCILCIWYGKVLSWIIHFSWKICGKLENNFPIFYQAYKISTKIGFLTIFFRRNRHWRISLF